jgi:hypothetical protein
MQKSKRGMRRRRFHSEKAVQKRIHKLTISHGKFIEALGRSPYISYY